MKLSAVALNRCAYYFTADRKLLIQPPTDVTLLYFLKIAFI